MVTRLKGEWTKKSRLRLSRTAAAAASVGGGTRCWRVVAPRATAADYKREGQGEALHIACAVIAAIVRFSMKVRRILP